MEYAFILLFLYASYLSIEKYVHTGSILKWRGGQRPASAGEGRTGGTTGGNV